MGRKRVDDIDLTMENLEETEAKERGEVREGAGTAQRKTVGTVERYYDKLGVVAITLTGSLRIGDLIEIGTDDEFVRQRVSSMQIDREDVDEAGVGESVGIKLKWKVDSGSPVYKIGQV